MSFENKVVIVTGASRGIGRATALAFGERKARVVVNYCANEQPAREVAELIEQNGGKALVLKADVSKKEDCEALVQKTVDAWETVDILVNNAGVTRDGLLMSMESDSWDTVINTNLTGPALLCKAVLPYMMMQKSGRIVNISSVSADNGRRGQTAYSASKGALNAFTRTLALEVAAKGVTVNAIAPGMVETDMSGAVRGLANKEILKQIPAGRYAQPEDIARCVLFLASDESSYITGELIRIDGGLTLGIGI
ncbi:MAG: beta-ketoacyl-ACP reductase [Candidatus Auribacterota bacterium]